MKVESGVATSTALQKIKVKEEKEECYSIQQKIGTFSTSTSAASTTVTTTTITTDSNSALSADTTTVATLGTPSTLAIVTPATTSVEQPTPLICQPPVLKFNQSNNNNTEPYPIDLDVKTKSKDFEKSKEKPTSMPVYEEIGQSNPSDVISTPVSSSREKSGAREENNSEPGGENRLSSPHQKSHQTSTKSEYKVGSRSSDNDSPVLSHPLKNETYEVSSKLQETGNNGEGNGVSNGGFKSISAIFSGHGKLKRLLGTLVQFAMDISPDTGDIVRSLVLGLLSGAMSAEEFHSALQEATNFPLRGFVLPYLKHTLPSLQNDLSSAARINNQSSIQYLRSNESAVLEAVGLAPSGESVEPFGDNVGNGSASGSAQYGLRSNSNPSLGSAQHSNNAGNLHHYSGTPHSIKRRASDTPYYENGALDDSPIYGKRSTSQWSNNHHLQQQSDPLYCWYQPLHSSGGSIQGHANSHVQGSSVLPNLVQINQLNAFGPPHLPQQQQQPIGHSSTSQIQNGSSLDDEWKNIYVMLNCILGMVEKTKRALAILQRRGCTSPAAAPQSTIVPSQNGSGKNPSSTNGAHVESSTNDRDGSLKRLSGEIVAQTIRATEDKVAEVKRRAEEAVQEVKRAAVAEVQRAVAVAVAESRATERLRVHRFLDLPLSQRHSGALRQSPFVRVAGHGPATVAEVTSRTATTPNNDCAASLPNEDDKDPHLTSRIGSGCWNCGRPALETCGGCGIARYCGFFCQHRDWEAGGHHANCANGPSQDLRRSSSRSPPRIATGSGSKTKSKSASTTARVISKGK